MTLTTSGLSRHTLLRIAAQYFTPGTSAVGAAIVPGQADTFANPGAYPTLPEPRQQPRRRSLVRPSAPRTGGVLSVVK